MPTLEVTSPVEVYARDVAEGRQVACRFVRLACERHLRDLEEGPARGLAFDANAAQLAIDFFACLQLDSAKPFLLQPWQEFVVGSLFGWKGPDGYRRFRTAYVEAAKGQGKTPLAAAIGLFGLVMDQEPAAEVYTAGVTRDQASYLLRDAVKLVEASPVLRRRIQLGAHNLAVLSTNSYMRPVSSEGRSLDQKRVHMALIDEIHEHPSSIVVDKMRAGTKGRRQALIFEITNSGYDRHSVCWQHHEYSAKVLEGVIDNDSWFAYVCGLDNEDDWEDESCWVKANPNLGVSITLKYLREQVEEARGMPAKQNIVKRLNFCIWTEQSTRWLDMAVWNEGAEPIDPGSLKGRECYGGLDLARVNDLSALALVFPPVAEGERWKVLAWFWCPLDDIDMRSRRDRVPYRVWKDQGFLLATEGNSTDFDFIEAEIIKLAGIYDIRELAFDRTFAGQIVQHLMEEGVEMVEFGQGFLSMAAPTAELQRLVISRQLQHGGHPILTWCASNVSVKQDPAGNLKPDKEKSGEKIDGIVALVEAIGVSLKRTTEEWFVPGMIGD